MQLAHTANSKTNDETHRLYKTKHSHLASAKIYRMHGRLRSQSNDYNQRAKARRNVAVMTDPIRRFCLPPPIRLSIPALRPRHSATPAKTFLTNDATPASQRDPTLSRREGNGEKNSCGQTDAGTETLRVRRCETPGRDDPWLGQSPVHGSGKQLLYASKAHPSFHYHTFRIVSCL